VLVDFGLAERYSLGSSRVFKSNLAYGTPEANHSVPTRFAQLTLPPLVCTFRQNGPEAVAHIYRQVGKPFTGRSFSHEH